MKSKIAAPLLFFIILFVCFISSCDNSTNNVNFKKSEEKYNSDDTFDHYNENKDSTSNKTVDSLQ